MFKSTEEILLRKFPFSFTLGITVAPVRRTAGAGFGGFPGPNDHNTFSFRLSILGNIAAHVWHVGGTPLGQGKIFAMVKF